MRKSPLGNPSKWCWLVAVLAAACIPVQEFGEAWNEATIDAELEGHWRQVDVGHPLENSYVSFTLRGDAYDMESDSASNPTTVNNELAKYPPVRVKTLRIGNHRFMLIRTRERMEAMDRAMEELRAEGEKQRPDSGEEGDQAERKDANRPSSQDGGVLRYSVENGVLTYFILKEGILEKAVSEGKAPGVSLQMPSPDGHGGHSEMAVLARLDAVSRKLLNQLADEPENWRTVRYTRIADKEADLKQSRQYPAGPDTAANTTVRVQLPGLAFFCEGRAELLRRHLQASPEWCVYQDGQEVVAHRRKRWRGEFLAMNGSNGYMSYPSLTLDDPLSTDSLSTDSLQLDFDDSPREEENYQIRFTFRFAQDDGIDAPSASHREMKEMNTLVVGPLAGDVRLKLKSHKPGIESTLTIGQPGLWFEFFEQTFVEERRKTRATLAWVDNLTRELQSHAQEIAENGYAAAMMPEGGVEHGLPRLELNCRPYGEAFQIEFQAWVNPGQQGSVFLRAFDVATGAELKSNSWQTREYIGWSSDPQTLFGYKGSLMLTMQGAKVESGGKVRVELWFRPSDGGASRRFYAATDPADVKLLETVTTLP